MRVFLRKLIKIFLTNFLIILSFVFFIELFFGYWFDKDNFGPYMREHRMRNQPIVFNYKGETYNYNYKRNYYGFRAGDIEPSEIEAIIMGRSEIDERYKPDKFTITGYLNEYLKKNNYNFTIINAGIEAQSTVGIIYNFKHWFPKLKDFSPKLILFYIGVSDTAVAENVNLENLREVGHVKNTEKIEVFFDNIKSRSFLYDSARIFKFKFLPRKEFIKYDGNIDPDLKNNFQFINYENAINSYDIKLLKKKYSVKIKNYLSRIDILYDSSKKINSNPIFITSVSANGNSKLDFIFNYSLISHCERKKYNCIDLAKKLKGNVDHWSDKRHTTKEGSNVVANIIAEDLIKIIKRLNLI